MKKKVFIIPRNDAEAIASINLIKETSDAIVIESSQNWGASWDNLEEDIKTMLKEYDDDNYEVYGVELKGIPLSFRFKNIDHHYYKDDNRYKDKTSIEQIADILEVELTDFEKMIAANDKGYMFEMNKLATKLELDNEKKNSLISQVNLLEYEAKGVSIEDKEEVLKDIDNAYIYDDRMIIINLSDFDNQRICTDILYSLNKYSDMLYNNVIICSEDKFGENRIVYFGNNENIEFLKECFKNLNITWSGGQEKEGFFGIQIDKSNGEDFELIKEELIKRLEERILGYNRIVKPSDIEESIIVRDTENMIPTVIHKINNKETFYKAISKITETNNHNAFVEIHNIEDYKDCQCFLVNAGCAGCAVTKDGNIISVFKNTNMAKADDVEKISTALLNTAINNGGVKLDCFDGFLSKNYMQHGFIPDIKVPFNVEYAPENWNYERDGKPYVVFFHHNGEPTVDNPTKISNEEVLDAIAAIPVEEDYDIACNYRDSKINNNGLSF